MADTRVRTRGDQNGRQTPTLNRRGQDTRVLKTIRQKKSSPLPGQPELKHTGHNSARPRRGTIPTEPQTVHPSGKRSRDSTDTVEQCADGRHPKRPRTSNPSSEPAYDAAHDEINPIAHWAREGRWPQQFAEADPNMERVLVMKKSSSSLSRKRSNSATSMTPSDQRPREGKSAPYRDPRYKTLLATKGSFMEKFKLGITDASKALCRGLLEEAQTHPQDSLFRDDIFETTCRRMADRNEAMVMRDITPLLTPSAEILSSFGAEHLDILTECVNEGWNNSIPLTGTRPQPDLSVGFRREAFTHDQLDKISPFIGDFITGDKSFFMATYYMYFPFLTCEVKCGAAALDVADRQNAHSMTLAVRAVVELFRLVKRESELHRQILAFSISHDHRSIRIYGHCPVMEGKDTKYYRHPIHTFDFTALDGKEKWTAYHFTKNVYDTWMPAHFKRICSAIDQLPLHLDFDVPPLPETGFSQGLESHHLSQSAVDSVPASSVDGRRDFTPDTSFTGSGQAKRPKRGSKGA